MSGVSTQAMDPGYAQKAAQATPGAGEDPPMVSASAGKESGDIPAVPLKS